MSELVNILLSGISNGAIYALCALGFTLAFNSTGMLNLLQGAFIVLGGLVTYDGVSHWGLPVIAAVLVAITITTAIAGAFQLLVLRPAMRRSSEQSLLLIVVGGLILAQGLASIKWGAFAYSLIPFTGSRLSAGGISIPTQALWIIGGAVAICLVLFLLLSRTPVGRALRAMAQNPRGARAIGIRTGTLMLASFAATGLIGGLTGALVTPYLSMSTSLMANFSLLGLIAISLGGYGSYFGAVIGGLALGLIEALATGYISSLFGESLELIVLIALLVVRPEGLLAVPSRVRSDAVENRGAVHYVEHAPRRIGVPALGALVVVMVLLPYLGLMSQLESLVIVGITAIALVGMDVLMGYVGMVPLGQSAFMTLGGYTSALVMIHWGLPPLLGIACGIAVALVAAIVLFFVTLRVSDFVFVTVSLAFVLLLSDLASNLSLTGLTNGLGGIPNFSVGGWTADTGLRYYYLVWGLVAVLGFGAQLVLRGRNARVMKAIAYDPRAAASLGADVRRFRFWALMFGATTAAISGALLAMFFQFLSPGEVGVSESLLLIVATVVGGAGTLLGPVIGAALFTFLPQISQSFQVWSTAVQGGLVIAVLGLAPSGLLGGLLNGLHRLDRRRGARGAAPVPVPVDTPEGRRSRAGTPA